MEIAVFLNVINNHKEEWMVFINSGDITVSFETEEAAKDFALKLTKDQLNK